MMRLGPDPKPETVRRLAERLARLICEIRASDSHDSEPLEARLDRTGMLKEILEGSSWLTARQIRELQKEEPAERGQPMKAWKSEARIFGLRCRGKELFPAYQFDEATHEPLPVIREILEALGPVSDPWVVAAWFHYPNGWITRPRDHGKRFEPIAPMHALHTHDTVLAAAASRRGPSTA